MKLSDYLHLFVTSSPPETEGLSPLDRLAAVWSGDPKDPESKVLWVGRMTIDTDVDMDDNRFAEFWSANSEDDESAQEDS